MRRSINDTQNENACIKITSTASKKEILELEN